MTTIAYRNGVMAADSGCWIADNAVSPVQKLAQGRDGTLYGVTGNGPECQGYLVWVEGGCEGDPPQAMHLPESRSSFLVLKVPVGGPMTVISSRGVERYPHLDYLAIGAGASVAMGALHAGASAEAAILAAIAHGENSIGPVQSVRHPA